MAFFTENLMIILMALLAFVSIGCVGLAFEYETSRDKARKRAKTFRYMGAHKYAAADEASTRRKQTQNMLKKMREQDEQKRSSLVNNDTEGMLSKAGQDISPKTFYIYSAVSAALFIGAMFYTGAEGPPPIAGIEIKSRPLMLLIAGLIGGIGFPRWVLNFLAKRRSQQIINQFAEAIDVIVRGVKSGLPLNECLQIIARESSAPLGPEFQLLSDNLKMGTSLERGLLQFYKRVPLSEINFFVIVLSIQAKAGGNLSEALDNLSTVIRSRKLMREKIKALCAEAKASAMIIGALPFAVAFMVYLTTPSYIMELFINPTGHMILFMAAGLMITGITVMRNMINFDI